MWSLIHGQCRLVVGFDGDGMIFHRMGADTKPFKGICMFHRHFNRDIFFFCRIHGNQFLLFGFPEHLRSVIGDKDSIL